MPRRPRERQPGRPLTIADPDKVARMVEAVAVGVPITQAAIRAGIGESTHFRAMQAGQDAQDAHDAREAAREAGQDPNTAAPPLTPREELCREYREQIARARAEVATFYVSVVARAAKGGQLVKEQTRRYRDGSVETERSWSQPDAKAAQFMLGASFRADFGKDTGPRRVELTGADGGPVETHGAADDDVAALAARLREVAETQAGQLPGGWDEPLQLPAAVRADLDVTDAEIVDEP